MAEFSVRQAEAGDGRAVAELFAVVAAERDGIATEPPVDVEERAVRYAQSAPSTMVAVAGDAIIGMIYIDASRFGFGDIAMLVDRAWRGRGVGTALIQAAVEWARSRGLHKLCLDVFAHNTAAIALYRKCGFTEEGRRVRQYRRASGEIWDAILMGRRLEP